jgi:outer membrane protein assembly factor BamB
MKDLFRNFSALAGICLLLIGSPDVSGAAAKSTLSAIETLGVRGGLVLQLGTANTDTAIAMGKSGRYIVNIIDGDPSGIERARARLNSANQYGIVSAEVAPDPVRLPYSENLVNAIVVQKSAFPVAELKRVLVPDGVLIVLGTGSLKPAQLKNAGFAEVTKATLPDGGTLISARKPRPSNMDGWSHPRHASDGNAVSKDTLVGPPRRIRWVAAATHEVEGMVTAGGRNFYGSLLARDSFNGLRLWHYDLAKNKRNQGDFMLPRLSTSQGRPIASDKYVFTIVLGKLVALDAETGEQVRVYGGLSRPREIMHHDPYLIAADQSAVRVYNSDSGKELWNFEAGEISHLVAGYGLATFTHGRSKRGEKLEAIAIDLATGKVKWRNQDLDFLQRVSRTVLQKDQLAFEISSFSDADLGNELRIVSTATGKPLWDKAYPPGMNHRRQARAMYMENKLWILHGGKTNYADRANMKRLPVQVSSLDPKTGSTIATHNAGLAHCFPPVATPNFMFAGTLDMTDLRTGNVVVNRITKANCSQENGWIPANGLVYTTPKHCTCWPMLRGFVSMAPAGGNDELVNRPVAELEFPLETGSAKIDAKAADPQLSDWPLYRNDRWRSGSTKAKGPKDLRMIWSVKLAVDSDIAPFTQEPGGPILHDWRENPVIKGPLSAPTVANGMIYVTRPNAHEVLAVDMKSSKVRWRFTANGRVDTPPAIHKGLALFGTSAGFVYALRADTGEMVWRLQAAPSNERIVAYGQVESPWPVPGAVLVIKDIAYFAAGRQPLADGGILVFAVNPLNGERHWVHRLDTIPQKGDYENSGLDFDPFDILHAEGDGIALSRWIISKDGKDMAVDKWNAFAKIDTGSGSCYIPRGSWTYGARHQHRFPGEARRRPLTVFRDNKVFGSRNGTTELFRRDYNLEDGEKFDSKWITGWAASGMARKGEKPYRTYRIADKAEWIQDLFTPEEQKAKPVKRGTQLYNRLHAIALADNALYVAHEDGRLLKLSKDDGKQLSETKIPTPSWDGMAIAEERIFITTQTGELVCLGAPFSETL